MIWGALAAFAHHAAAFMVAAALAVEYALLCSRAIDVRAARWLRRADALYGASAGLLLAVGLLRVFFLEKGTAFYFSNVFFLAKLGLFIVIGLASIHPTRVFRSWAADLGAGRTPALADGSVHRLAAVIRLQMAGLAGILLCAALMARGIGAF